MVSCVNLKTLLLYLSQLYSVVMILAPHHGVCLDGVITIICHTESDCKSNNDVCEGSRCQSLCDTDDDCTVGHSCVLSICTSNCSVSLLTSADKYIQA